MSGGRMKHGGGLNWHGGRVTQVHGSRWVHMCGEVEG
jgi:hypothetical protein